MGKIKTLILFASSSLMLAGCTTVSVPPLTTGSAGSYTQHEQKNGVAVGIHPMTDRGEIKDMFKANLLEKGLLPILVVVENQSPAASFIVAKEKIVVLSEATGTTEASQRKQVASDAAGTVIGSVGAAATIAPLLIVGLQMASNAAMIEYNLADKEFYSRTLGPGEKAQGFVYFGYPKDSPPSGTYHVMVELKNSATGVLTSFDFPVNLTPTK